MDELKQELIRIKLNMNLEARGKDYHEGYLDAINDIIDSVNERLGDDEVNSL